MAKVKFATTALAQEVFTLVKENVLRATSIGIDFHSQKRRELKAMDLKSRPDWAGASSIIEKAKLLEFSFVSIGANQDALVLAQQKGLVNLTKGFLPSVPSIRRKRNETIRRRVANVTRVPMTAADLSGYAIERARVIRGLL